MTSGSVILFELGICILDHEGNVVLSRKFGDPVGAYDLLQKRQMPQEIKNILYELNHFDRVVVNEDNLYSILKNGGQNVEMMSAEQQHEYILFSRDLAAIRHSLPGELHPPKIR